MRRWMRDNRGFVLFVLGLLFVRTAVADWNPIPSGSMRPTLLEGDVVLVDRLAYDLKLPLTDRVLRRLADPQRGDVVTFHSPRDGTRLIKRIVALPGDRVELRDGVLVVNGEAATYDAAESLVEPLAPGVGVQALRVDEHAAGHVRRVQLLRGASAARDFGPLVLPEGRYFMLGDNRDNSADSRFIGPVPRQLIIGRAHHVLLSADILGAWWPRASRFGAEIR
ncbi:MAG: signal peptidase I [Rubrivivax sp.]